MRDKLRYITKFSFLFKDYDLEDSLRTMVEAYFPVVESDKSKEIRPYHRQANNNLVIISSLEMQGSSV